MSVQPANERPPTPDELAELMQPGADWDRDGFHPTMSRPFPSMQCTGVVKSGIRAGQRCAKRAVYGASVCLAHGAQLPVVRRRAEALVEAARLKLVDSVDDATDWLLDLAENSTSEAVRLKATESVLDRAGIRGGTELDVNVTASADPGETLRTKLADLRRRTIEGEVVRDAAEDGTVLPVEEHDDDEESAL